MTFMSPPPRMAGAGPQNNKAPLEGRAGPKFCTRQSPCNEGTPAGEEGEVPAGAEADIGPQGWSSQFRHAHASHAVRAYR